jgi:hypothetical protein
LSEVVTAFVVLAVVVGFFRVAVPWLGDRWLAKRCSAWGLRAVDDTCPLCGQRHK